jgi:outer membrane protein OmpA-like peptidoglycan-associated protein
LIEATDPVKAPSGEGGVVQKDDKTSLIYFPSGSAQKELNKDVDDYLLTLAEKLKSTGVTAKITGHSDNKGKYEANLKLSKDRAEQVKSILIKKGVDPAKLLTLGIADKEPLGDNNTDEGRRVNRRVEIVIQ